MRGIYNLAASLLPNIADSPASKLSSDVRDVAEWFNVEYLKVDHHFMLNKVVQAVFLHMLLI